MVKIREADRNDSGVIFNCINGLAEHLNQTELVTATENDIRDIVFGPDSHVKVFVAENDEVEICGYALILKTFSTFKAKTNYFIEDLFVFPAYRNRGIGNTLFNYIREYAGKQGAGKVEWYVNNANQVAIDFYRRIGAKELDYKSIFYFETK